MPTDSSTARFSGNDQSLGEGIYVVGCDLAQGQYSIKCLEEPFNLNVTVFDSMDSYKSYHSSPRFTVGEENDAIAQNATKSEWIYTDDELALELKEGNILMIKDGRAQLNILGLY